MLFANSYKCLTASMLCIWKSHRVCSKEDVPKTGQYIQVMQCFHHLAITQVAAKRVAEEIRGKAVKCHPNQVGGSNEGWDKLSCPKSVYI